MSMMPRAALLTLLLLTACGATDVSGRSMPASLSLAERAQQQNDHTTAVDMFTRHLERDPASEPALLGLGRSYIELGQFARAELALEEVRARSPRSKDLNIEFARLYLSKGDPEKALVAADAAMAGKADLESIIMKGLALDGLSRHVEAQEVYRKGLKLIPTDFTLLSNYGLSLALSGNSEAAIAILSDLAKSKDATSRSRGNLALAFGLNGDEAMARKVLAQDLSVEDIEANIRYYAQLRASLRKASTG